MWSVCQSYRLKVECLTCSKNELDGFVVWQSSLCGRFSPLTWIKDKLEGKYQELRFLSCYKNRFRVATLVSTVENIHIVFSVELRLQNEIQLTLFVNAKNIPIN